MNNTFMNTFESYCEYNQPPPTPILQRKSKPYSILNMSNEIDYEEDYLKFSKQMKRGIRKIKKPQQSHLNHLFRRREAETNIHTPINSVNSLDTNPSTDNEELLF